MKITNNTSTGRRAFLTSAAAATIGFGFRGLTSDVRASGRGHRALPADPPAGHGMLLFGEKRVYLSHLPLFSMQVHRYQVLLEATFTKAGGDPQAAYVKDRRAHPDISIYTFDPSPFVLPELDPKDPKRKSFTGRTVRGHFERKGNVQLDEGVTANVTRVVHFRPFDAKAEALPELEYLLFGEPDDAFLAHLITRPPDFDHVLSVKVLGHQFTAEELSRGVPLTFPGKPNTATARVKGPLPVAAQIKSASAAAAKPLQVQARAEIYFEEGELESA
jgi:hypothetical protein